MIRKYSSKSKIEIKWWIKNLNFNSGKLIRHPHITCLIETDASSQGWRFRFNNSYANGRSILVLLAIFHGLKYIFLN